MSNQIYVIHQSDLNSYRRCRRKWKITSSLGMHLKPSAEFFGVSPYLWQGTGFHFGLEDAFGYKRFSSAKDAFNEYVNIHRLYERPLEWEEIVKSCDDMLDYYENWEHQYGTWETLIIDGKPQVEVEFALKLDGIEFNNCPVIFGGKIDRIVKDEFGKVWLIDYKTAKSFVTSKLDLDTQVTAYCWAAEQYLDMNIEGMIYIQIHKSPPKPPKILKAGISTDKSQRTTYDLYLNSCIEFYGEESLIPDKQKEFLNRLKNIDRSLGDEFINISKVERNEYMKINFYNHLINMAKEMTNPNLSIYPNPTPDCSWDCPFKDLCIAKEEGADWQYFLEQCEKREEAVNDEEPMWLQELKRKFPEKYER